MSHQSPLISLPRKTTTDVDWSGPIRSIISQSYGEDPKNYAEECSILQRCRQDAVKGAGSDQTARDLLYKYFGQLELLELRFAEIKVPFVWNDAFTLKPTTQTSLAFEKASIIHLLASVLSSIASSSSRADPEGIKRAYHNLRASAGMLTYINENFLHAPSVDLGREVVHVLIGILMAQSTEVFTDKLISEKKSPALVCRSANSAAAMYAGLVDEMKEFQGKGVFDRNWLYVLQIKSKLFLSMAQYYRSVADQAAGKHGVALVRMRQADLSAQDALKQVTSFHYGFYAAATTSLPSDAATSLLEIAKAHAALCSEAKEQATRDNELIYHDILPTEASLAVIDKLPAAAPITIQEVYSNPDVSKLIGPDIFIRLVPLAVHESASVYSEEKAQLVRGEVERVDLSEGEIRASLEHLGLPGLVNAWRKIMDGDDDDIDISPRLRLGPIRAQDLLLELNGKRRRCEQELHELTALLDAESRECEKLRAKHSPRFNQPPSSQQTGRFRQNISSNLGSISAAAASDERLSSLWQEIAPDIDLLSRGDLKEMARQVADGNSSPQNLLDFDDSQAELDVADKKELGEAMRDVQERLDRLSKIRRERDDVLKDLKEKIQSDDVSSLLLLNRRSQHVEPQLFASELEKFRPYQGRISSALQAAQQIISELEGILHRVERNKGAKLRQRRVKERQRRVRDWEMRLENAVASWSEIDAGVGKGTSFYDSMTVVLAQLSTEINGWLKQRKAERDRLVEEIERRTDPNGLESRLASLSVVPPRSGPSSPYDYPRTSSNPLDMPAPPPEPTRSYRPSQPYTSYQTPPSSQPVQFQPQQPQQPQQPYPPPQATPYGPPSSNAYHSAASAAYPAPPPRLAQHSYHAPYPPPPARGVPAPSSPYGPPPLPQSQPATYPRAPPPPPSGTTYPYTQAHPYR